MKKFIFLILCVISYMLCVAHVTASSKVSINEILIEPAPQKVELFNAGTDYIDISGWHIDDSGGSTFFTIPNETVLYPNACLVFEGDFNLNKTSSDAVRLFDATHPPTSTLSALIDSFSYKASSGSAVSFQRVPDGELLWTTSSASLGSYNLSAVSCVVTPTPTPLPSPTPPVLTSTPTPVPSNYTNIYIFEVMANPNAGDSEWVKLYNDNEFATYLYQWYVDDRADSGSAPFIFSLDIPGKSYAVLHLTSSMFNNDGDKVRLLDQNKNVVDAFSYSSTIRGKSIGKTDAKTSSVSIRPTATITTTPTPSTIIKTSVSQKASSKKTRKLKSESNVLGNTVQISSSSQFQNGRIYSFLSLSYSILTILSVFFKMKFVA